MKILTVGIIVIILKTNCAQAIDLDALFYQSTVGCELMNGAPNPAPQCRKTVDLAFYESLSIPVDANEVYGNMSAGAGRVVEFLERDQSADCFAQLAGENTICRSAELVNSQPGSGNAKPQKREQRYPFDRFSMILSVGFLAAVSGAENTKFNK